MSLREGLERVVPAERELILRSGTKMRYLRLGRVTQLCFLVFAVGLIGWSAFATSRFLSHHEMLAARDSAIVALREGNSTLDSELAAARNTLAIQEQSLTATQRTTVDLTASNQDLAFRIAELEAALLDQENHGRSLALSYFGEVEARARAEADVAAAERARDALNEELAARDRRIATLDADRVRLGTDLVASHAEVLRLKDDIETLNIARAELGDRLVQRERELANTLSAKRDVIVEREELGSEVVALSERLEAIETAQLDIVSRLGEQAGASGDALKRTLSIAGLDVDRLLDRLVRDDSNGRAVGGPLLALDDAPGAELVHQISTVERRIDDFEQLQDLMERLPLVAPLDEFRLTSAFGRRIDPFTKRYAMHAGIDLASRRRAPVYVTSPGTVTSVGWKGGFGKVVEVDHGLGIRTRYAHLSSIYVKRGQKLEFREKVGQIGSTGRSTGEHLHYEVIVDGRAQDPSNFIKAGQYVFKK